MGDVEKAKVVGSGCFMIYKGKGFSGPSVKIEGASPLTLKEQGHSWTTVKSILYSSNCNFSRQAGAEVYVIVGRRRRLPRRHRSTRLVKVPEAYTLSGARS